MMIKIISKIIPFLAVITLLFFNHNVSLDEDYTKVHKEKLDASLGEWKVTNDWEVEVINKPFYISERQHNKMVHRYLGPKEIPFHVPTKTWLVWELEYKDNDGKKHHIRIENLTPLERDLISLTFKKLEEELKNKIPEESYASIEGTYLRFGDVKKEYFIENYSTISELYGDKIHLKNAKLENVFKGTPIYASIRFTSDYFSSKSEDEMKKYVDKEMGRLSKEIPYLNAYVYTASKEGYTGRFYIQGKEVEAHHIYDGEFQYRNALKEHFPEYELLEPKKKFLKK